MRDYFRNIYSAFYTICLGLRITLRYYFAKTVTVQYPDVAPVLQPRFRGFHYYQIEKCIACDLCAKACPVDCIYIEKSGPRKFDKQTQLASGGAMLRFAIDYAKCMFCALCVEPCPTECIHMGQIHDLSGYDRQSMIVEFTELARQGRQTPQPLWMRRDHLPDWAAQARQRWAACGGPRRERMLAALQETRPARPDSAARRAAPPPGAGAEPPRAPDPQAPAGRTPT